MELPLRAELFSVAQLQQHARTLAGWHQVDRARRADDRLLARLDDNEVALRESYALIAEAVKRGRKITPAAEWFLDNYHLIEEQVRTARLHLPRGYNRELPRLANGPTSGTPRVYDLAHELIAHSHGRIDRDRLTTFIEPYQEIQALGIGELWAIPIMLRLALLENMRRVVANISAGRVERERAMQWAERLLERGTEDPSSVVLVLAELVREGETLTDPFVSELASRLRGHGAALAFAVTWLEQWLVDHGQTLDHVLARVSQEQASAQVAISNSIGSLRVLGAIDWRSFVEDVSAFERVLSTDPAGVYQAMDFGTRDRYRHVVEAIARAGGRSEVEVATLAIGLAQGAAAPADHVGWYLVGPGRKALQRAAGLSRAPRSLPRQPGRGLTLVLYLGAIAALTVLATWGSAMVLEPDLRGPGAVALWIVLALCNSRLAIALIQGWVTALKTPSLLPRLDFSGGIPAEHHTLVAVPCMLTSAHDIDEQLASLEVRYLANRDPHLHFALLTDLRDAGVAEVDTDAALLAQAVGGILALNRRHAKLGSPFALLHRARRHNPAEGAWMGWERKRGKLEQLNDALRGDASGFDTVVGTLADLQDVRYVIVLDADTELPRDAARSLASILAHPLNRPRYDPARGRVVGGYGILQPRVGVTMGSATQSRFAALFGSEPGIDPYTRAVSDVYQDLFGEGSFVGKGIYDVDAMKLAVGGRLPENRVLSHDLLEGSYCRAGLVSDVMLFEDHPAAYTVDVSRRHRWMRGDWQLTPWLGWRVPAAALNGRRRISNPVDALGRWKILDNLRRSLVPVAEIVVLVVAWSLGPPGMWATVFILAIALLPTLLEALGAFVRRPLEVGWRTHVTRVASGLVRSLAREFIGLASLPHDAWLAIDAIARTAWRVTISHTRLLQWRTALDAQRSLRSGIAASYLASWISPVVALGVGVGLALRRPVSLWFAAPMLLAWLLAPALTWWISRPPTRRRLPLSPANLVFLRGLARRTWHFFERYVGPDDNHLPPDNFQEDPPRGIAHRTSPTNIGVSCTANLAAYDLGYIEVADLVARTERTFAAMDRLARHRGHFFNWYDTTTLKPLEPLYVSTVDSGNLSAHLLTLAAGLEQLAADPLVRPQRFDGLAATLDVLASTAESAASDGATRALLTVVERLRETIGRDVADPPTSLAEVRLRLVALQAASEPLERMAASLANADLRTWIATWQRERQAALAGIDHVAPWLVLGADGEIGDGGNLTWAGLAKLAAQGHGSGPLGDAVALGAARARAQIRGLGELAARARGLAEAEYGFLYDRERRLLSIGFSLSEHRLDASFYDLLASEARLASYVAIAQGQLPQEHWFSLGRMLTSSAGRAALLSWSGSMFEYLMPLLVMPTYDGTLLDETYKGVIARQIAYGDELVVPWGISESGYSKLNAQLDYQYKAFGVPGLGFKRGLGEELVVAPYASVMALMVDPRAACDNLLRLEQDGRLGKFGFYEAIDYTRARLPPRTQSATVRSYMAHHQGMALLAFDYVLRDRPMQRRFLGDPALRATELLLQERVPKSAAIFPHPADSTALRPGNGEDEGKVRFFETAGSSTPEIHLLSNGRYHVAVTNAGGGYSRWKDLGVTRWREDPTRDADGMFGYVRDVDDGSFWSIAHQPTAKVADRYAAIYSHGRAEFRRRDGDIETHVEIGVSPEDDVELRRVSITNHSLRERTIELTSYAEVVLNQPAADTAHAAFSNLFVQTELVTERGAILCTRRPRSPSEDPPWMFHIMTVDGRTAVPASFESSRAAFIGRNRSLADPMAMHNESLGNSAGAVLDPIVAIRNTVRIAAHGTVRLQVFTGIAAARAGALELVERYSDYHLADRLLELAYTHSQVEQRRLGIAEHEVQSYDRLASSILYGNARMRAPRGVIARNVLGQASLWAYGISGDLPIVLVRISSREHIELVRQSMLAHAYWRSKGLVVDLVIWNEDPSGYRQELQDDIMAAVGPMGEVHDLDRPGGIFVRRSEQLSELDSVLMQTIARAIIRDDAGSFAEQVERRSSRVELPPPLLADPDRGPPAPRFGPLPAVPTFDRPDLTAWNGTGGFTGDGREYVITTQRGAPTPAPWSNVMANAWFGSVVTDSGGGYTWCENAHSYRITPWLSDPVSDASGEAIYLRDEQDGRVWSPSALPAGDAEPYLTRHGFGYSVFEHTTADGIATQLTTFVATDAPIRFHLLELHNRSGRARRISVTVYLELVLGAQRPASMPHVVTEIDPRSGAMLARNSYDAEFAQRIAFLDSSEEHRTVTGDRTELLGRNGGPRNPAGLQRAWLSGRVGAGHDPCMAIQVTVDLAEGQRRELAFTFGSGRDRDDALHLIARFRGVGPAREALARVWDYWGRTLGRVTVRTPDPTLDFLANGWLVYQVLASRIWARSGFYQSGGAFGFRDQLQDAMALVHAEPALLRDQILRCAGRQFREGDVQHWWHPPVGRGVRTRISDDYLWLPYATCRYIAAIGDTGVLDEPVHFLEGRAVKSNEDSYYDLPVRSEDTVTLYEHCVRSLEHGMRYGVHGLPLMGTGDWNDGMNLVGDDGKGESVWLAFFFHDVLVRFSAVAQARSDTAIVERCLAEAAKLATAIEAHGWDGAWYRRAYFDDGTPLGSSSSEECQIDSLPQSWAALTGLGDPERTRQALDSMDRRLIRRDLGVVQLLDPPFDVAAADPGYIKGYVPGVRENGGQYTHAAVWAAMAFARVGDARRAWEVFEMINPLRHGDTARAIATYKVEPYVVAADVYTNAQHAGRGGWTWYTGSAGWMYRLVLESLLGLHREVDRLRVTPVLREGWDGYEIHYRFHETVYHIRVRNLGGDPASIRTTVDGAVQSDGTIALHDDRRDHDVEIAVGPT